MNQWRLVPLAEVATIVRDIVAPEGITNGTLYVGLENIERGGALRSVSRVSKGELASAKFAFRPSDLLYGKLRPNLAKIARPDFEGICSTDILPVRPGPKLDRDYLAYCLLQPEMVELATQRASGANLPRLGPSELARFCVPLPPLEVQHRIARVLHAIDELRTKRMAAGARLRELYLGALDRWLRSTAAEELPVGAVAALVTKGTTPTSVGLGYAGEGVPFLRAMDLGDGEIAVGPETLRVSAQTHSALRRSRIQGGDVLLSIAGTIGRVATVPINAPEMNCNQAVAIVRPAEGIRPTFLRAALQSSTVKRQIVRATVTGTISNLSLAQVRGITIRVPPLGKQAEFETMDAAYRQALGRNAQHLSGLTAIFDSLRHRSITQVR